MHICGYTVRMLIPVSSQESSVEDRAGIFNCTLQISKMRLKLLGDLPRAIQLPGNRAQYLPSYHVPAHLLPLCSSERSHHQNLYGTKTICYHL